MVLNSLALTIQLTRQHEVINAISIELRAPNYLMHAHAKSPLCYTFECSQHKAMLEVGQLLVALPYNII